MSQKLHILIVDPQNDFCTADDGHGNKGTLVVPGADADMSRLSRLVRRLGDRIDGISTTMDSHQTIGIERPRWWVRVSDGAEVAPFTCLGVHSDGKRIVKLNGFVQAGPGFFEIPQVVNGASDLMVEVFADKGRHARSTIGVSVLPLDAAVEVEGMFEVN